MYILLSYSQLHIPLGVLPWDMVDKSISPYKPISGWFFRPEAVWTDHLTLE